MNGYTFPGQNVETIVGNGRLIARASAGSLDYVFAGPAENARLLLDGEHVDDLRVDTFVRPARSVYTVVSHGTVTHAAQRDALLSVILIQADEGAEAHTWTLEVRAEDIIASAGELATATSAIRAVGALSFAAEQHDPGTASISITLAAGESAAFVLGESAVVASFDEDPSVTVDAWEAASRRRGLRLRSPDEDLDLAVGFAKAHMQLGYDWRPEGEAGAKMVCDIFRWRDVWSRDFGSGFGPGAIAANMYDAVLDTLDYEAARYAAHDPVGLKVSDDTSQGGSAEALGWVLKLVWRVYKHTGDAEWLARMAAAFEPWVEMWISRDADDDGLIVDVTEWMDHSRFLRLVEGQRTLYSNALYYAALRRMAYICGELGRTDDAARYQDLAHRSRTAIHDGFWNEAGYFNNAIQWGVSDTGLMLADNAITVIERIASRNERFRTLLTIRERSWRQFGTVTTDLPMHYISTENDHNQKVWPWWMAHEAKARFLNFDADGGMHVLKHIVDTFSRPTLPGLCEEYLAPDDGSQDDVVGHAFITGSGAMLDAVLYGLVGLSHREPGDRVVRLAPAVPRTWDTWGADIELFRGTIGFEQTPEGYRVQIENTRIETLELRIPPRETVELVLLDGAEIRPAHEEDGASATLRIQLTPGASHVLDIGFAQQRVWSGDFAMPALPEPVAVARPLLMDEPRLFADILQGFVRAAVSFFGRLSHVATADISTLEGSGDLLVIVGNELPLRTKRRESVPSMIDAYVERGGSLLLLGPRFPPISLVDHYHGGANMGGEAGMFWWKDWKDGEWVDVDPRTDEVLPHPIHQGTVYWGDGPLFAAWEHSLGLFGFGAECRGVYDAEGGLVEPDAEVHVVYTDWTVRKPWSFTPLAFTRRNDQQVTGPKHERYPCAALLQNAETGARIIVVSPSICSRADLLHRILGHVVALPKLGGVS